MPAEKERPFDRLIFQFAVTAPRVKGAWLTAKKTGRRERQTGQP
jgi:hypothetical protein